MPGARRNFEPELTLESKMNRMRDEMYRLRHTIISLVAEPYQIIIEPPYDFTRDQSRGWLNMVAHEIIGLTKPDADAKAACPLCGNIANFAGSTGYAYPDGLHRHLTGSHNAGQCPVTYAADGLRRVQHREKFPNGYGAFGCD
jgi:hypothetical protein